MAVKIVTINILNDLSRWRERRDLLIAGLAELQPDLVALQEVHLPENNGRWLADQLGGYELVLAPKTGSRRGHEGIAILSRLPIERTAVLDLQTQDRVAQWVQVSVDGRSLVLANGHFYWWPGDSAERVQQVQLLLDELGRLPRDMPIAVCGDFNGTPESRAIQLMRTRFASAYAVQHGCEPDYTCPTPLTPANRFKLRHLIKEVGKYLLSVQANRTVEAWHGTLDYIFVSEQVRVMGCEVVLNRPAPGDPTLYPSDHFGVAATVEMGGAP